jgi:hypothetical protein
VARPTLLPSALLVLGLLGQSGSASARTEVDVGYTREQTFSAALRYLRVDLSYEVTEKDSEAAYLLFSFASPEVEKKVARGSIEVVQRERSVRVVVTLPQLPSYQEEVLKRGLLQKLLNEYGEPPPAAPAPKRDRDKGGSGDSEEPSEKPAPDPDPPK